MPQSPIPQPRSDYGDPTTLKQRFHPAITPGRFGVEIEVFLVDQKTGQPVPLFQEAIWINVIRSFQSTEMGNK